MVQKLWHKMQRRPKRVGPYCRSQFLTLFLLLSGSIRTYVFTRYFFNFEFDKVNKNFRKISRENVGAWKYRNPAPEIISSHCVLTQLGHIGINFKRSSISWGIISSVQLWIITTSPLRALLVGICKPKAQSGPAEFRK